MIPFVLVYWFLYSPCTISEEEYYSLPWEKEANVKGNASISDNKPSYPQEVYDVYRIYRAILENLFK